MDQTRDHSVSSVDMPTQDQGNYNTDLDNFQFVSEDRNLSKSTETNETSAVPTLRRSTCYRQPPNKFDPSAS